MKPKKHGKGKSKIKTRPCTHPLTTEYVLLYRMGWKFQDCARCGCLVGRWRITDAQFNESVRMSSFSSFIA